MTSMDERNERLGQAIDRLPVPEHGPEFWEALRGQMAGEERDSPLKDRVVDQEIVELIPMPERRRARQPWLLAGAAAAVIAVVGVGLAVRAGDGTNDEVEVATAVATEEVPTEVAPTEVAPTEEVPTEVVQAYSLEVAETIDLGQGRVVGLSRDAAYAYITDVDPEVAELGCEGAPWESLYVQNVATGERVRVGAAGEIGATGLAEVSLGAGGRIAILTSCEEFVDHVYVGTIGANGMPENLVEMPTDLDYISDLQWYDEQYLLLAGATFDDAGGLTRAAYLVRPEAPELIPQTGSEGALHVSRFGDQIAIAYENGDVLLDGQPLGNVADPSDIVVAGDGAVWVSSFTQGLVELLPDSRNTFDDTPVQAIVVHYPRPLWVAVSDEEGGAFAVRGLADGGTADVVTARLITTGVLASLDGSALAYTEVPVDPGPFLAKLVRFTPA